MIAVRKLCSATDSGAARFDGQGWTAVLDGSGTAPVSEVWEIVQDAVGTLWFRTDTGLYRWLAGEVEPERVSREEGLAHFPGDLVIDESVFESAGVHPAWPREDIGRAYAAPAGRQIRELAVDPYTQQLY